MIIYKTNVKKRKMDMYTLKTFGIGFSGNFDELYQHLKNKGFTNEEILESKLVLKSNRTGKLYDAFRNRLMFTIKDVRDRVIAFGGRALDDSKPKYINSPDTVVYNKGRHLFAMNIAKKSGEKSIMLVEGYMDAISLHQRGITNVVAALGTALTTQQGWLLRKNAEQVILGFDSDGAGQNAILRSIEILQNMGCDMRVLQMEGAKDPDEYVLKYGPERFEKLIDNSISPVEYKVNLIKNDYDFNDTTQKIAFLTKLAEILTKVDNNIERDVYVDKFSRDLKVGKEAIIAEIEKRTLRNSMKVKNWQSNHPITAGTVGVYVEKDQNEDMIFYLLTLKNNDIFQKLLMFFRNLFLKFYVFALSKQFLLYNHQYHLSISLSSI